MVVRPMAQRTETESVAVDIMGFLVEAALGFRELDGSLGL